MNDKSSLRGQEVWFYLLALPSLSMCENTAKGNIFPEEADLLSP